MDKSPISILQEICAQSGKPLPNYFIEEVVQHGILQFLCTCTCGLHKSQAVAQNKRDAKTESANIMLAMLFSLDDKGAKYAMAPKASSSAKGDVRVHNYVGDLNEYASNNNTNYPNYQHSISNDLAKGLFMNICSFLNFKTFGYGANKKQAKQAAAKEMLEQIKVKKPNIIPKVNQLPRAETLEANFEEVIKKYNEFSLKLSTERNTANTHTTTKLICDAKSSGINDNLTTAELMDQLKGFNVAYVINTFQLQPLILSIQIKERNLTLMGTGKTRDEALQNLLSTTIRVLRRNFSYRFL